VALESYYVSQSIRVYTKVKGWDTPTIVAAC